MRMLNANSESGQTMAEYAVTLTVITAAIMLTLGLLAGNVSTLIGGITDIIDSIV
jgi:Flp pilus assembly pilin Flp